MGSKRLRLLASIMALFLFTGSSCFMEACYEESDNLLM